MKTKKGEILSIYFEQLPAITVKKQLKHTIIC